MYQSSIFLLRLLITLYLKQSGSIKALPASREPFAYAGTGNGAVSSLRTRVHCIILESTHRASTGDVYVYYEVEGRPSPLSLSPDLLLHVFFLSSACNSQEIQQMTLTRTCKTSRSTASRARTSYKRSALSNYTCTTQGSTCKFFMCFVGSRGLMHMQGIPMYGSGGGHPAAVHQ